MILGRGQAQTEEAVIAEYRQLLRDCHPATSQTVRKRLLAIPDVMKKHIGKPFFKWADQDIINLYARRGKATQYGYSVFLAFLFFRGYRQATLNLLTSLHFSLARHFRPALVPIRQQLIEAEKALQYKSNGNASELKMFIYLLAFVNKSLEELTRKDFDSFRDEYQAWYRKNRPRADGSNDSRLTRLEYYLIHWNIIPPAKRILSHEMYFSQLQQESIRAAILLYLHWCNARYKPSTTNSHRAALLNFFLWLQDNHPHSTGLEGVTRLVVLNYARHLKQQVESGHYSSHYATDLHRSVRLFFDFVIDERLDTSPDRNPFTMRDLPRRSDPVPRYLSDQVVRSVLTYCDNGASLKEQTIVITLLHTGIRAAELAALKTTNIVQIQGTWKLHIQEGKGLKDRLIPLTPQCLQVLQAWQRQGWEGLNEHLFTRHGRPWKSGSPVGRVIRKLGLKLGLEGLSPHRFRHTFAVALLNYGIRESALQKLMGHTTLNMTLEYARILDKTVEQAFNKAVAKMQTGPISWAPNFLQVDDYATLANNDAINWIRLPHGYCRRHSKLHCESDVKCLLCDRFCASVNDLPQLQEMYDRFLQLEMRVKADAVYAQIIRLQADVKNNGNLSKMPIEEYMCANCS